MTTSHFVTHSTVCYCILFLDIFNYLSADIQTMELKMYYLFSKRSLVLHSDDETGLER